MVPWWSEESGVRDLALRLGLLGCVEMVNLAGEGDWARGGESNDIGNGRALALSNTG